MTEDGHAAAPSAENCAGQGPRADGSPCAAVLLLREDGAALMQHRDDKPGLRRAGQWVPPGGHCEPGEDLLACARRELLEETGYRADDLRWLASVLDEPGEGWPPSPLTVFWARYDGVQPVRCLEGQALKFVERGLACSYPVPAYIMAIWDDALAALGRPAGA